MCVKAILLNVHIFLDVSAFKDHLKGVRLSPFMTFSKRNKIKKINILLENTKSSFLPLKGKTDIGIRKSTSTPPRLP